MSNAKIALVTGGSRNLGKDMALALAGAGADVIITYNTRREEAEQVVAAINTLGRKSTALQLDLGDINGLPMFMEQLKTQLSAGWGVERFDYLINNGGVGATLTIPQVTEADFDRILNINYKGPYFLTQKCLPVMNDGGTIINISSGTTRFCAHGYSVYAGFKSALETYTRYLAKELGPRKITANTVAPGPVETDFNNAMIRSNPQVKAVLSSLSPLGRVGVSEDIGGVVAFLCSDAARWINGQRIEVSGGINL
ncbi:MAG: SDR family oxidoreductase [Chitinophagales bacterium]